MQYNYIWFICTLLDSCVPIRILGHLIRLYIGSWQDYLVLPMGLAWLTGLANESCQMFGGILPSLARIQFLDIWMSCCGAFLEDKGPESILGSCHSPPWLEQEGVKCAQKTKTSGGKKGNLWWENKYGVHRQSVSLIGRVGIVLQIGIKLVAYWLVEFDILSHKPLATQSLV